MARMKSRWQWLIATAVRKLWFRASLFSLFAVATALVAPIASPRIPPEWSARVGADALDDVLGIIASTMLTVTIFSLTTMVSAYASAASTVTPRATRLLLEDATSQNAMSTFLGAFLFSLVGIIALSTGVYGDSGRLVLFGATVFVIVVIVVTLLRWISHLSTLGRMGDTINRVERAARQAFEDRIALPCLGGRPPGEVPASAKAVHGHAIGYVEHVDMNALQAAAGDAGSVWVAALPGAFVHRTQPLAWTDFDDEARCRAVREAFTVGHSRTYDQDPRFGLVVLAEIASRALSPAVNDPGTAIDILGTGVRVLDRWCSESGRPDGPGNPGEDLPYPSVRVPPLSADDLFEDLFAPIARDGAGTVEVGIRLQKSLAMLADAGGDEVKRAARRMSATALEHAEPALTRAADRDRLAALAKRVGAN